MNKVIFEQLNKVKNFTMPEFTMDDVEIYIPKIDKDTALIVGSFYKIKIANYVVNEPPNFTLASNWNNGTTPPEEFMKVQVVDRQGKMIKVKGFGDITNIPWEGFLPIKSIEQNTLLT